MTTVVIDPGHGGTDSGASFSGNLEKNFNLSIALKIRDFLQKFYEVNIVMTRESDTTMSLKQRTDLANSINADFYLSVHNNAGRGSGFESYIYNGTVPPQNVTEQKVIHDEAMLAVKSKYNIIDRGKKRANFHVLRETAMSAILLEVLFVDNTNDLALLNNPAFIEDVSSGIAKGVAKALALPVKTSSTLFYKVFAGSFKKRDNAEQRIQFLATKGMDAFIVPTTISGEQYYRVQAGTFSNKDNSEKRVEVLKQIGITDAFIISEGQTEEPESTPPTPEELFTIKGETHLLGHQLDDFVRTINPDAPNLGKYYVQYGDVYGIRADVAYAQAIHETDYFRFTGIVQKEQNNYAGIGATGPGNPGTSFQSPEEGVHAHMQHLFAYASTDSIPEGFPLVDPRFNLVRRGSATTWTQLNGKWAVPGTTYGQSIISIFKKMVDHTIKELNAQKIKLEDILNKY